MAIHPTAVVSPTAEVDSDVEIGPYATIGDQVIMGPGNVVHQHVTITGHTTIGSENMFYPGAIIGTPPQDLKYRGEDTQLIIGNNNTFREYVTANTGTEVGGGITAIGDLNLIMAYCHIAHDCFIESNTILANGAALGGHVKVEEGAAFGGMIGVHHFVTVGKYSYVGGMSRIAQDVPPFMLVEGNPARVRTVNSVGLKRKGLSEESMEAIKFAWRKLYKDGGIMSHALEDIKNSDHFEIEELQYLVEFIAAAEAGKLGRAREAHRND
ncbi:MAG: acyl-ACP--UDP-N-acetylglucosamine O-acyltransferase [Planctomycetota bacterium]|jgi:UDP-N-acetylglucosamine acyltransferase|nr:acyl-ACP--UDP-N-acetylglucosamine O-acyltransferase [Planctomycetota bacterium]